MVLVSIVGDFYSSILPIFYEYKDSIEKHILLFDSSQKDVQKAKSIKKGLKEFKNKYGYSLKLLSFMFEKDSYQSLQKCSDFILFQSNIMKEIIINTTDGSSSISIVLSHILLDKGVNFLTYDMYENKYSVLYKTSLRKYAIKNSLHIHEHFLLKGYTIQSGSIKKFAQKYEAPIKVLFEKYYKEYNEFTKLELDNIFVKNLPNQYRTIREFFLNMNFGEIKIRDTLLMGTLFEVYIYNLLKNLPLDDIEIGLKVFKKYKNSNIVNEFDILIMKENHLHMIECKFRANVKLEELIYKYIALRNIIDEDGKIVIVTKKEPDYDKAIEVDEERGKVYKRGILYNITIMGAVHKNPLKFVENIKEVLDL